MLLVCYFIVKYYDINSSNVNIASKVFWPKEKLYILNDLLATSMIINEALFCWFFSFSWFFFPILDLWTFWSLFIIVSITIQHRTDHYSTLYRSPFNIITYPYSTSYRSPFNIIPILIQHRTNHHSTSHRSLFNTVPITIQHYTDHHTNPYSTSYQSPFNIAPIICSTTYRSLFNIVLITIQHHVTCE